MCRRFFSLWSVGCKVGIAEFFKCCGDKNIVIFHNKTKSSFFDNYCSSEVLYRNKGFDHNNWSKIITGFDHTCCIQQILSKPVIICISIAKYIFLNLRKCPSCVPDESSGIKSVLNNHRRYLYIILLNMIPRNPTISTIYIYICIWLAEKEGAGGGGRRSMEGRATHEQCPPFPREVYSIIY